MSKPRELHFTSHINPYPKLGYHMDKTSKDIFVENKDWVFVEKAAYDKAIEALKKYAFCELDAEYGMVTEDQSTAVDVLKELGELGE